MWVGFRVKRDIEVGREAVVRGSHGLSVPGVVVVVSVTLRVPLEPREPWVPLVLRAHQGLWGRRVCWVLRPRVRHRGLSRKGRLRSRSMSRGRACRG